jgi:ppGpp synthetase/RelA/SpoT-type nucleotidyltranferase
MDVIEEFIQRYVKEYDFYSQSANLVAKILESNLRSAGIRCIVTSRAKSLERLEVKCRQRAEEKGYGSVDDIFDDIADLAGVRVALYFPKERDQVDRIINNHFQLTGARKEFPEPGKMKPGRRFSGYSATHYRVRIKDAELGEFDKRYNAARVEIQVASVLMHAWSEVEHDLVYKPLEGELSAAEYEILDQLNGLVIAGELALTLLQGAGEQRVAQNDRRFLNHYELAVHLLSHAAGLWDDPVGEAGLGRVDQLFDLLVRLDMNRPASVDPYLAQLHGNIEERPLAEQVIDAIIAEEPARYATYTAVRLATLRGSGRQGDPGDQASEYARQLGTFIQSWIRLESMLGDIAAKNGLPRNQPLMRSLRQLPFLDDSLFEKLDILRQIRNRVMHGDEFHSASDLANATAVLDQVIEQIQVKLSEMEQ